MVDKTLNHLSFIVGFDEFWEKYPRKDKILQAYCEFHRALDKASSEEIIAGLDAQNSEREQLGLSFICEHPNVWLNREGWKVYIKGQS